MQNRTRDIKSHGVGSSIHTLERVGINTKLDMLNRLLGKQNLAVPHTPRKTGFERGTNDIIEQKRPVNKECKAKNLQPFEGFPAQAQRHNPNKESA